MIKIFFHYSKNIKFKVGIKKIEMSNVELYVFPAYKNIVNYFVLASILLSLNKFYKSWNKNTSAR